MSFDRVTKSGTRQSMLSYLEASQKRLSHHQVEVASGKRLHRVSDSPTEATEVIAHRRQLARMEQFARNSDSARSWLDTTDAALSGATDVLVRGRTLVVQATNASHSPTARSAIAAEMEAMADQLLALANSSTNGRPLFAGTSGSTTAFDVDGVYLGAPSGVTRAIGPGQVIEVGRPGSATFGTFDASDPMAGNAFQVLRATAEAIRSGDPARMQIGQGAIETANQRVLGELGRVGSLGVRLESMAQQRELQHLDATQQMSQLQDVDVAQAILNLRSAEAGYQATLAATARLLDSSLLDFLR